LGAGPWKCAEMAGPDRPENSTDHDNELLDGLNSIVAVPAPSVTTGGTSWSPSSDASQMVAVAVVEYAAFGLARIIMPIRNIKLIGNESALNCIRH
jgi:hypothetical protein